MGMKQSESKTHGTPIHSVIYADCSTDVGRELVTEKLMELPFFKKYDYEDITIEKLEKALAKLEDRYPVQLGYIMSGGRKIPKHYSFMLRTTDEAQHLDTIYAATIKEGFEKILIYLFHYCKRNYVEV